MFHGTVIEESLVDTSALNDLRILGTEIEEVTEGFKTPWLTRWTLRTVEIPDEQADKIASKIAAAIDPEHASSWFADFENETTHYVIFRDKVFKIDRANLGEYAAVKAYALLIGVPEHQLGFLPKTMFSIPTQSRFTATIQVFPRMTLGVILAIAALWIFSWNEQRVDTTGLSVGATEISGDRVSIDVALQGKRIAMSGNLTSKELLGDGLFLKPAAYLRVDRSVEMFAWKETIGTEKFGHGSVRQTFSYTQEWTSTPADSSAFTHLEGHQNPAFAVTPSTTTVDTLTVGAYRVAGDVVLPEGTPLTLTDAMLLLGNGAERGSDVYVFLGAGTLEEPKAGDIRVSYTTRKGDFVGTVVGALHNGDIERFTAKNNESVFRIFDSATYAALQTSHRIFVAMLWFFRVLGFLLIWSGCITIRGGLSRLKTAAIMLPLAVVMSVVSILVAMLLHSFIAVVLVDVVTLGAIKLSLRK